MLDGVLTGPEGRWPRNSGAMPGGSVFSSTVDAPTLDPRERVVGVPDHGDRLFG